MGADLENFRRNFLKYLISIIQRKFAKTCVERVSSSVYKDLDLSTFLFYPNNQDHQNANVFLAIHRSVLSPHT